MKGLFERALRDKIETLKRNIKRFQDTQTIMEHKQLIDWLKELEQRRKLDCHYTMMVVGVIIITMILLIGKTF